MPDLPMIHLVPWAAAAVLLLAAVAYDVAFRIIPDAVPLLLGGLGVFLHALDGHLVIAALLAVAVFAMGAWCWHGGFLGGGDVKLLAACTLMLRPEATVAFLLSTALAGGALAVLYLALRRLPAWVLTELPGRTRLARVWRIERHRIRHGGPLPYACAICAGAIITACGS